MIIHSIVFAMPGLILDIRISIYMYFDLELQTVNVTTEAMAGKVHYHIAVLCFSHSLGIVITDIIMKPEYMSINKIFYLQGHLL